jgi:hypothetical protein
MRILKQKYRNILLKFARKSQHFNFSATYDSIRLNYLTFSNLHALGLSCDNFVHQKLAEAQKWSQTIDPFLTTFNGCRWEIIIIRPSSPQWNRSDVLRHNPCECHCRTAALFLPNRNVYGRWYLLLQFLQRAPQKRKNPRNYGVCMAILVWINTDVWKDKDTAHVLYKWYSQFNFTE